MGRMKDLVVIEGSDTYEVASNWWNKIMETQKDPKNGVYYYILCASYALVAMVALVCPFSFLFMSPSFFTLLLFLLQKKKVMVGDQKFEWLRYTRSYYENPKPRWCTRLVKVLYKYVHG